MTEFSILFSQSRPGHADVPEDSVVIWPVDRSWNDHGFGFQARALIRRGATDVPLECPLFVVPDGPEDNRFDTWLDAQWPANPGAVGVVPIAGRFFSILKSERQYREIARLCAGDHAEIGRILRPMRDVVYFKWNLLENTALTAFLQHERVKKGIFRHQATYLAWHRGVRILAGEPATLLDDARREFSFATALPGFAGRHSLRVGFGAPEPLVDRCHALIGRNGSGKSRLLRELILKLGERIDGTADAVFIGGERSSAGEVEFVPADFNVNRVVAMSWDVRSQFPANSRLNSPFQYFSFGMNDNRSEDIPFDPLHIDASETQASLLIQVFRDIDLDGDALPYERLRQILRPVLNVGRLCVYLTPTPAHRMGQWVSLDQISGTGEGNQLELFGRIDMARDPQRFDDEDSPVPLSSGERAFLNFGIRGAARLTQGSLLIMDEPETHLHPNLISDFMRILAKLLVETRSIAIIATHSPFVVRELPGRCVHIVELDEQRNPSINTAFLRTLGASIDQLSIDIFGDAESDQLNRELAAEIVSRGISFEDVRARYGRDLSPDLLGEIRDLMTAPDEADSDNHE